MSIFKHTLAPAPAGTLTIPASMITIPANFISLVPVGSQFALFIREAFNSRNVVTLILPPLPPPPLPPPFTYHDQTYRICENVLRFLITPGSAPTPPVIPFTAAGRNFMRNNSLAGSMPVVPTLLTGSALQAAVASLSVGELSEVCVLYAVWYLTREFEAYIASTPTAAAPAPPSAFQEIFNFMRSPQMEVYSHIRFSTGMPQFTVNQFVSMLDPNKWKLRDDYNVTAGDRMFRRIVEKIEDGLPPNTRTVHDTTVPQTPGYSVVENKREDMVHFANALMEFIGEIVLKYSSAFFNALTAGTGLTTPSTLAILASGEGGGTEGILGQDNRGILFFKYNAYCIPNDALAFMRVSSVNRENNIALVNNNRTLHMAIFGLDFAVPTKVFVGFTVAGNNYEIEFQAKAQNAAVALPDPAILIPPIGTSGNVTISAPVGTIYTITDAVGALGVIGTYDSNAQNLTFSNGLTALNSCNVRMESAPSPTTANKFDEASMILTVIEDTPPTPLSFSINLLGTFRPDEFELSLNRKANDFPDTEPERDDLKAFLDNLFSQILANPNYTVNCNMNAGFIGRYTDDNNTSSEIVSDSRYLTLDPQTNRTIEYSGSIDQNSTNDIDSFGYNRVSDYANFRFSRCNFNTGPASLTLDIASFVDPQRSGLGNKLSTIDFRSTITTVNPAAPGSTTRPSTANLALFVNPSIEAGMPDLGDSVPSYNWVLSGLRCFGILEAVIFKVEARLDELIALNIINPTDAALIRGKFTAVLDTVTANIGLFPGGTATTVPLNGIAYQSMKWYRNLNDSDPNASAYWNYNTTP